MALVSLGSLAEEPKPRTSVWLQPVGFVFPLTQANRIADVGLSLPLGFTRALTSRWLVIVELDPYFTGGPCADCGVGDTGLRRRLAGFASSAGVAYRWKSGVFVQPKLLFGFARETGPAGSDNRRVDSPFVPGNSFELGLGLDVGFDCLGSPLNVVPVLGLGAGSCFSCEEGDHTFGLQPILPLPMLSRSTETARGDHWVLVPNLNLLRFGFAW